MDMSTAILRMGKLARQPDGAGAPRYELAQVNVARLLAPLSDPLLADFVANLQPVYAIAEASAGFVWRLPDVSRQRRHRMFGDEWLIVNLSVWVSPEALVAFVYGPSHRMFLRRRLEWFARLAEPGTALWWVPAGHRPTVAEAEERLTFLRTRGPTAEAFRIRDSFPAPDGSGSDNRKLSRRRPTSPASDQGPGYERTR
jgi:Domain of unknown function (DUF3291)